MTKRERSFLEEASEQSPTEDEEVTTPTNENDTEGQDFPIERNRKRVKQSSLFFTQLVSEGYSKSHFKHTDSNIDNTVYDEYDLYLLFSENNTPTKEIKQLVMFAEKAVLILTIDHKLYFTRNFNDKGLPFKELDLPFDSSSIIKIVATSSVAYALTKSEVFAFSPKNLNMTCDRFASITDEEFIDISASFVDNIMLLTNSNRILTSGWNKFGMLGDGTTRSKYGALASPKTTHTLPVKFLTCGSCFSIYSSGNSLYATGDLENIGNSKMAFTFEEQTHFKFEVSDLEKIIASPLFTCFWTKQHELHVHGRGINSKINLNHNIYSIEIQYTNIFCCYQQGSELSLNRRNYIGKGEFTNEVVTGYADLKFLNAQSHSTGVALMYYQSHKKIDTCFKTVVTYFSDITTNFC